jgi:Fe-S oxidoreductase
MTCQRCQSKRIAHINSKCSDLCFTDIESEGISRDGYAPRIINVTGPDEDYVEFRTCLDCGQMQGKFPVKSPQKELLHGL